MPKRDNSIVFIPRSPKNAEAEKSRIDFGLYICYNIINKNDKTSFTEEEQPMLEMKSVTKKYITASETVEALRGVYLSFRQGEFVSVLGPSGCGKTTLLNLIGGLDRCTDGDIVIDGVSTKNYTEGELDSYRNHSVGFVFQSYNLIPHQTVLENVELSLTIGGVSGKERTERARQALDRVGLAGQYDKLPKELSGGQCQRVAIARALVNDPGILLLDEPTGALDGENSVRIMELLCELSGDRLVIMVTHDTALAKSYSTRIIRLEDGRVVSDTQTEGRKGVPRAEFSSKSDCGVSGKVRGAKMSFATAFRLSLRNLLSKKGRTLLVSLASSVGIIGIALVLAFSAGVRGYISHVQKDMMSGNPITVATSVYNPEVLTELLNTDGGASLLRYPDRAHINGYLEFLIRTSCDLSENLISENRLTEDYIEYLRAMSPELYADVAFDYGIELTPNLYTEYESGGEPSTLSLSRITDTHASILSGKGNTTLAMLFSTLSPKMKELPGNREYVESQYDVLAGKYPEGMGEIVLVLTGDGSVDDLLLANFGYFTSEDFAALIERAEGEETGAVQTIPYSDLLGKVYTYYPTDSIFKRTEGDSFFGLPYEYLSDSRNITGEGVTLTVVGIVSPKESISYGALSSGIYYTKELTEWIIDANRDSEFINGFLKDDGNLPLLKISDGIYGVPYQFRYEYGGIPALGSGIVTYTGEPLDLVSEQISSMFKPVSPRERVDRLISALGGSDSLYSIAIYPNNTEGKSAIVDYLNEWNSEETLTLNGREIPPEEREPVTYSDSMELVLGIIDGIVNTVSAALIAFTSISLLVSTVMIGIITYVSVVERTKEIGVIRSLGGRRRDVGALFTAETLIIGLCSGLFGIFCAYLASFIINPILGSVLSYGAICALPVPWALLLVLVSVLLTLISGALPSGRAARLDPAAALRTE